MYAQHMNVLEYVKKKTAQLWISRAVITIRKAAQLKGSLNP